MKKNKHVKALRIWTYVFGGLLAFLIAATIVITQVPLLYYTLVSVMGDGELYLKSGDPTQYQYYTADYDSKEEVYAAAKSLNEEITSEGIVLLKNEDNALPLKSGAKLTVFGKNSVDLITGGSGSNSGGAGASVKVNVAECLEKAGFVCNPTIQAFYKSSASGSGRAATPTMGDVLTGFPVGEAPIANYTSEVRNSYAQYNDAAIVVLSRICGEGYDLPRTMFKHGNSYLDWSESNRVPVDGAKSVDSHYLELDQNETDMLKEACDNFGKVIVIVNSGSPIELGFLVDSTDPAYNAKIKAALWLGNPGQNGTDVLGKILKGEINPSAKTVDIYTKDFTADPTWYNFGSQLSENGNRYIDGVDQNGKEKTRNAWFVEYREGIYTGYRYYETKGYEAGGSWYADNVCYPFGYGLSYTTFTKTATPQTANGATLAANGKLSFDVTVKNTGSVAGKEVVQVWFTSPYTNGGIEKAQIELADFAKTENIAAGESATVTVSFDVRDMASYDYNDANRNGFKGYELEAGDYTVYIGDSSNCWSDADTVKYTYTVPAGGFKYKTDDVTGETVSNRFDDVSKHISTYLSRKDNFANFDCLQGATEAEYRTVTKAFTDTWGVKKTSKETDPWYSAEKPEQAPSKLKYTETTVKLYELIGKDYVDTLWDELLDQLTVAEMSELIATGNFRTLNIEGIDKPLTVDADGPMGFAIFMEMTSTPTIYDTCFYASETVLAATWNSDLAYRMGKMVGNEGIIGNERGDGRPYSGWYAPAMNLHRSQFGGRNFEYYSEDAYLSGEMAANVVKGAREKGVYTYMKHFALNEQETKRDNTGLLTWCNEQAMRENYFLPFEKAVKEGGTTAMMSSFNRIGATWAGGNYELLTGVLRNEWGFRGMVITDYNLKDYMDPDQMIRAGGDLSLSGGKAPKLTSSATDLTVMRQAVKNILYTVANSCAMNGHGEGCVYGYTLPAWLTALYIVDGVIFLVFAALASYVITYAVMNKKGLLAGTDGTELPEVEIVADDETVADETATDEKKATDETVADEGNGSNDEE